MLHPLPWKVDYWVRVPEWDTKSRPHIVDANGNVVCFFRQTVNHIGEYDEPVDQLCHMIVAAVNQHPELAEQPIGVLTNATYA